MKSTLFVVMICFACINTWSQNIGINATGEKPDKSAMLDINSTVSGLLPPRMTYNQMIAIPSPAPGLMVYVTRDEPGLHVFDGNVWRIVRAAGGNDNLWYAPDANSIVSKESVNVGINTTSATNHLQVGSNGGYTGVHFVAGSGSDAIAMAQFNGISIVQSTNNMLFRPGNGFGFVGINTPFSPTNTLQIGSADTYTGYDFSIGRNSQSMAIYQGPNFTNWTATDNITINPKSGGGYVGINVGSNPANKLQIGSVGNTGFATNDLAIGNGTNAMAFYQTDAATTLGSTTDIIFMPRNNGHGRVGINTTTPRAPLDVVDEVRASVPLDEYSYINGNTGYSSDQTVSECVGCHAMASIYASNAVVATEFDAYSDIRIKNIIGASNATEDLATINALRIKDYTMKDKVRYGNRHFKKVIAQEVEQVYPLAVSKHTDFIPNVYQSAHSIEKTKEGWLLTFSGMHNMSSRANKIKILIPEIKGWQEAEIVSIPNASQIIIKANEPPPGHLFVYGEQVDDFRTVDYESLSTLNISATQALSKEVSAQKCLIDRQQKLIVLLEQRLTALENKKSRTNRINRDLSKN